MDDDVIFTTSVYYKSSAEKLANSVFLRLHYVLNEIPH